MVFGKRGLFSQILLSRNTARITEDPRGKILKAIFLNKDIQLRVDYGLECFMHQVPQQFRAI